MIRRGVVAAATVAGLVAIAVGGPRILRPLGGSAAVDRAAPRDMDRRLPPRTPRGEWVDARGRPADRVLDERTAGDRCSWRGIPELVVGEPLGTRFGPATRFYLRDADGRLARDGILLSTFAVIRGAPPDAKPTGYRRGPRELWRGADGGREALYIVDREGGRAERWPRLRPESFCR